MDFKDILSRALVIDQEIHLDANLSRDELVQIANYLQYHINNGTLPHWRPVAWTYHLNQPTFMRQLAKSCPLLGDRCQVIADRIANVTAMGDIYKPPKNMWGYTQHGDIEKTEGYFTDIFGFMGNAENGTGHIVEHRRRDILNCSDEDIRMAFCRQPIPMSNYLEYYSNYYEVPTTKDREQYYHTDISVEELLPVSTIGTPLHYYHGNRTNISGLYGMGDIRPVFIILFQKGTGYRNPVQNSKCIIPEFRDSWAFCNTDYSLNNQVKVVGVHSNIIDIEFQLSNWNEKEFEKLLRNI